MEFERTPKPDPIILGKPDIQRDLTPTVEPQVPTKPSENQWIEKIKTYVKTHKKLSMLILAIVIGLCAVLTVILLTSRSSSKPTNDPVSAPVASEKVKPFVLSKKCAAENQGLSVSVPEDWNCGKNDADNPELKDLRIDNSEISIVFPVDTQAPVVCNSTQDPNCTQEDIYSSDKVTNLTVHRNRGNITTITAILKFKDINLNVVGGFKNINTREITAEQKALIIQILESAEYDKDQVISQTLDFNVSGGFQLKGENYNSLDGKVITDKEVTLTVNGYNHIEFKKGNSKFIIFSFHEEFRHPFKSADLVGATKSLGNVYRVSQQDSIGGEAFYYAQPSSITFTGSCLPTSFASPADAPCGTVGYKGFYFQCSGDSNFEFCDKLMTDLDFTVSTKVF